MDGCLYRCRILLRSGTRSGRHYTSAQALKADLTYAFCSVKNHGIPEESIDAVISVSKLFFSLPQEEKIKVGGVLVVFMF